MSAIDSLQPFMNVLPQPKSCGYVARILRQAYRRSFDISVFNITEQTIVKLTINYGHCQNSCFLGKFGVPQSRIIPRSSNFNWAIYFIHCKHFQIWFLDRGLFSSSKPHAIKPKISHVLNIELKTDECFLCSCITLLRWHFANVHLLMGPWFGFGINYVHSVRLSVNPLKKWLLTLNYCVFPLVFLKSKRFISATEWSIWSFFLEILGISVFCPGKRSFF